MKGKIKKKLCQSRLGKHTNLYTLKLGGATGKSNISFIKKPWSILSSQVTSQNLCSITVKTQNRYFLIKSSLTAANKHQEVASTEPLSYSLYDYSLGDQGKCILHCMKKWRIFLYGSTANRILLFFLIHLLNLCIC